MHVLRPSQHTLHATRSTSGSGSSQILLSTILSRQPQLFDRNKVSAVARFITRSVHV